MTRGADYDPNPETRGVPQSDNAIDAGKTQAVGTGTAVCSPSLLRIVKS